MPQANPEWRQYERRPGSTVTGELLHLPGLASPQLGGERGLLVLLPPSYHASERRYPVLYMHDAQNVFDAATSFSGEWQVDESMLALAAEGIEAIVVGIPNGGDARADEYSPWFRAGRGGGKADQYLAFLAETVKPLVDASFRTEPGRESTGIAGSSLGGLVSLYALCEHPDLYGFAGVMSPAFWFTNGAINAHVQANAPTDARIWVDVGDAESPEIPDRSREYVEDARRVVEILRSRGYGESDLAFQVAPGAPHHESAWARRFPEMMRFWLSGRRAGR